MTISAANASGSILVVDDQPANRRVVSALLSRHGYEVITADSGEEALAIASEHAPDLLLLDMIMPGMDGIALFARLNQRLHLLRLLVMFLTPAHDRALLLRGFAACSVDHVSRTSIRATLHVRVPTNAGLNHHNHHR